MNKLNLLGQRFGRLLVISEAKNTKNGQTVWICECDCGKQKELKSSALRHDKIKSCGCLLVWKADGYIKRIHYPTWWQIKDRCNNPNNIAFKNYGAKGIQMCKEWSDDYGSFHKWMVANNWKPGLQIDRYPDKNGHYSPDNCRLATPKVQQNNKNNNIPITYQGETKNISEWAAQYGLKHGCLFGRLKRGWDVGLALTTPTLGEGVSLFRSKTRKKKDRSLHEK